MKGFTAIEILIVIAIMVIIAAISLTSLVNLNNVQALNTETDSVLSILERARARSISSENSSEFGVHFASTSAALFAGKNYSAGAATNEVRNFNGKVQISSINLRGGVVDLYFNRLTGKPSATGTVVFSLSNSTTTKTITIYNTGLSDVR